MSESIQNDGGFKGGETIAHAQGRTALQAPLQSAYSSPSDALIARPVAIKSDKVVTRVVTDLNSGWGSKHTRVLGGIFIGEQNRCICDSPSKGRTYLCPPAPPLSAALNHKNIFPNFGGSNVH